MCYSRSESAIDTKAADRKAADMKADEAKRREARRTETIDTMVSDANRKVERAHEEARTKASVPAE